MRNINIPDPIELVNYKIERMIDSIDPDGKCMGCNSAVGFEAMYPISERPDSPVACWNCCVEHWGSDPSIGVQ